MEGSKDVNVRHSKGFDNMLCIHQSAGTRIRMKSHLKHGILQRMSNYKKGRRMQYQNGEELYKGKMRELERHHQKEGMAHGQTRGFT